MTEEAAGLFAGKNLRADLFQRGHGRLLVTFDFRTPGRSGFRPLSPSNRFATAGFDQLVIRSAANDWFINADTEALEDALRGAAARYGRVQALGYSMGGYGALRFAKALGLQGVVAVSPQATLDPAIVPWETRYKAEVKGFDPDLGALGSRGMADLAGIIVVDPFKRLDMAHAGLIQEAFPGLTLARVPFGGHPATRALRQAGKAWIVQREALSDTPRATEIVAMHRRHRREAPIYWDGLSKRAGDRRPALAASAREMAEKLAATA